MRDVVGVGTNSVDDVLQLPVETAALMAAGKARLSERQLLCGGQTATVMAACASLGLRCRYVGAFGSDDHGTHMRQALLSHGVEVDDAIECDAPNRSAVILVDPGGHRTVLWHRSPRLRFPAHDIRPALFDARVVHVDDEDPDLALRAARVALQAGAVVTSDIEQVSPTIEALVSVVTYPIFEQHLAGHLTGETDPERALRKLRRLNTGLLCMTLGEAGAAALDGDRLYVVPACRVAVVDTTGAGDVFRAGFIYGLLQHWSVPDMLRFANVAAAVSCMRLGAIPSVPALAEVQDLLSSAR